MRLLQQQDDGEFRLTENLGDDEPIPPYAILSHRWLAAVEEPTFEDLTNGTGKNKPGYEKIRFCGDQARLHGLQYFWVDTCCINKKNDGELSHAIRSMFRWYRNATRCYVYLSDVSISKRRASEESSQPRWETAFRSSQWHRRGWTLQELIAPISVEFFSRERRRLGDKQSLEQHIHEITGIPRAALRGARLSHFSDKERFSWIERRETKIEEDKAYSLLGIFDVQMPLRYGEGMASAFNRLEEEIEKLNKCLQDLRLTDPRDDKKRIEDTKGGLLTDSYHWILENTEFLEWRMSQQSRVLWIKGDAGKGKTMLLSGIINQLEKSETVTSLTSFFFCQAIDSRINNGTSVLRGLIYMIVEQQPSLVSHIRKKYDRAGKALFEDGNKWIALSEILANILSDPNLDPTYMIIDALDECMVDSSKLINFIVTNSAIPDLRVKWIVSSRNWPEIEEKLEGSKNKVKLRLELNADSIATAVGAYIDHKVLQLAQKKKYKDETRKAVLKHLKLGADNTFLWVALVCQNLENVSGWKTMATLNAFPPGLNSLYQRMMEQICHSEDADLLKEILASMLVVYRPITLKELRSIIELLDGMADDVEDLEQIVRSCGSFLTVREGIIYFVHQSAKDYLLAQAFHEVFPLGREQAHYAVFSRSLQVMSNPGTLKKDMYHLESLGYPAESVEVPDPDPLAASRYSIMYWVDHLCDWISSPRADHAVELHDRGLVDMFIREKYVYWLEALSLCGVMSHGVVSMTKLESMLQVSLNLALLSIVHAEIDQGRVSASALIELVHDAYRFIMYHKQAMERSPLQVYASALVFSPARSLIKGLFRHEKPNWIKIKLPRLEQYWSPCLQFHTLEGSKLRTIGPVLSSDSNLVAGSSTGSTINIWDSRNGSCLQTLKGHGGSISSLAFSPDSTIIASGSIDCTVKIWNWSIGACLKTFEDEDDNEWVSSLSFSADSTLIASGSRGGDHTIRVWNLRTGTCLKTLRGHDEWVSAVTFSPDSTLIASGSDDQTIRVWNSRNGACLYTLEGHRSHVSAVNFSVDSTFIASGSLDGAIKIWNSSNGACLHTLKGSIWCENLVIFSPDSSRLLAAGGETIKVWDSNNGACLQILNEGRGPGNGFRSIAFQSDSRLVSTSRDGQVKVLDVGSRIYRKNLNYTDKYRQGVRMLAFSGDSTTFIGPSLLASVSIEDEIKIWDTDTGACLQTIVYRPGDYAPRSFLCELVFWADSTRLLSTFSDSTTKFWDIKSGTCLHTRDGHKNGYDWRPTAFSADSARVACGSNDLDTVEIWDTSSWLCLQTLKGHVGHVYSVAFSAASTRLVSASDGGMVRIWDASNWLCLQIIKLPDDAKPSRPVALSPDLTRLAAAFDMGMKVCIWDANSGACLKTLRANLISALAFSSDSTRLALRGVERVEVWHVSSGARLHTFETGWHHSGVISFDAADSCLHTRHGDIAIDASLALATRANVVGSQDIKYQGAGISKDYEWITYDSKKALWVPLEYRSDSEDTFIVSNKMVAMGNRSGKVLICSFDASV